MNRYCEVRLVKSFTAENIIDKVHNKKKSTIAHTTSLLQKHPINMVYSSTKKCDKINKSKNEGISCSAEHTSAPQKKVTRNSLILQNQSNKELPVNKKTIISGQSVFQVESSKLNKNNEYKFDEIPSITRKRQSLEEENNLYRRRKLVPKPPIKVTERSKETKQTKLKKKRNTQIIIWERKLTGAQRVSKRLSNLRTKNKNTGQMESFSLIPVALINKTPVKLVVPNKMLRSRRTTNKNRKEKSKAKPMLFLHKERTEKCNEQIQNTHPETPSHQHNKHIVKLNPKIASQYKFVESQTKDYESQKSVETTQISDSITCGNIYVSVGEVESKNVSLPYQKPEETGTNSATKCSEEINVIQNTELIDLQNKENINKNDITENIEILQEDCLSDSDVIVVELGPIENMLVECPNEKSLCALSCENKFNSNSKDDTSADTLGITDDVQSLPTQTDLITGDILKINKEACDKTHDNTSDIPKTDNVPENMAIKLDDINTVTI